MSAAILAGGKSSRFGSDKSAIRLHGKSVMEKNVGMLEEMFGEVVIISNSGKHSEFGVPVYTDKITGMGPLSGIHSALSHCSNERCFIVACDMPFVSKELVSHIVSKSAGKDATVPVVAGGIEPLLGVYSKKCLKAIEVLIGIGCLKTTDLLDCVDTFFVDDVREIDPSLNSFFNVNYQQDFEKAEAMA